MASTFTKMGVESSLVSLISEIRHLVVSIVSTTLDFMGAGFPLFIVLGLQVDLQGLEVGIFYVVQRRISLQDKP
jgi:hypothetical protein